MSDTKKRTSGVSDKRKAIFIALAAISFVIIVGLICVIVFLLRKPEPVKKEIASGGRGILVTEENAKSLSKQEPVADGYYTTSMNIDWYFDNGTAKTKNAYVENDVSNTRTVYFDLYLADTGETVYSSPYMPVGSKLEDFALTKDLGAGDYDAVVKYHLVDDEYKELSDVSVSVKIHVLK